MGQWLFAMERIGQVTEIEEAGVVVLAASLFEDGERVVRKSKTHEFLAITDSVRLRYTPHRSTHTRRHSITRTRGRGID